ncbi:hypothetical protein CY658_02965 [Variovorax sp. RO1]|uniref:DUF4238 domain-containing protein n=1 Tax=Variovorax sp. RO1 TaxID=2066034 RepID=UPI000C7166B0|nr:DUF4238 domain-containing protein [Variovorax sp. RO1]PLC06026.1 hypothetical protein CY658_02965 [Variovorax sp. RO1]
MGHHYVPQYYLRGFAVSTSVWVYDKQRKAHFRTQVKSTGNERGMYSAELESFFSEKVEGPANEAISKARDRQGLDEKEREALARYLAFFWQRVPRGRDRAISKIPQVADEVETEIIDGLTLAATEQPDLSDQVSGLKKRVKEIIRRHRDQPSADLWRGAMLLNKDPRIVEAVATMNWQFAVSDTAQFLTCDNPVFFYENEGVGRPQSELSFPISSSVTLVASNCRKSPEGRFFRADAKLVTNLNRRTAHNAQRFAFAQRDEPWIMPFLLKKGWPLPRLK